MTATTTDHTPCAAHSTGVGVVAPPSPDPSHPGPEDQLSCAGSGDPTDQQPAVGESKPVVPASAAGGSNGTRPPASPGTTPNVQALGSGAYDALRVFAESFTDAQDVRIRIENRLRSGTIPPDVASDVLASQRHTEKLIGKEMVRAFRAAAPEVHAWTKETVGLGESTMARLLGVIGHPVIARPHHWETGQTSTDAQPNCAGSQDDREEAGQASVDTHTTTAGPSRVLVADEPYVRNVAKLWAYCGHGDPARRKRKGMDADDALALGSPHAKKLVWLLAVACVKQTGTDSGRSTGATHVTPARRRSPYRDVYDNRRIATADRVDADGKPWTPGHQHADAIRITGKAILRDLWIVAHRQIDHLPRDTQTPYVDLTVGHSNARPPTAPGPTAAGPGAGSPSTSVADPPTTGVDR